MADPPNVSGVRATLDALQEFSTATGRNVVQRALIKAAQPVVESAKSYAPDDPETPAPDLKSSIIASPNLTRRARQNTARANEVEVYIGPSATAGRLVLNYASFEEFGTVHNPAHPYLRPAWDGGRDAFMDFFARELANEYEKTATRIATRFFKRG